MRARGASLGDVQALPVAPQAHGPKRRRHRCGRRLPRPPPPRPQSCPWPDSCQGAARARSAASSCPENRPRHSRHVVFSFKPSGYGAVRADAHHRRDCSLLLVCSRELSLRAVLPHGREHMVDQIAVLPQGSSSAPAAPSAPRPVPGAGSHDLQSAEPSAPPSPASASLEEAMQRRRSLVWGPIVSFRLVNICSRKP